MMAPLVTVLLGAAIIDSLYRRIPNWLTLGLLVGGIERAVVVGLRGEAPLSFTLSQAGLGILVGGLLPLALYAMSALGGGDVKIMAAVGAWIGPKPVFTVFLAEAIVGLVLVLAQALYQRRTLKLFHNSALIAANFAHTSVVGLEHAIETGKACRSINRPLPFAVPLLIATVLVLWIDSPIGR